MSTIPPTPAQRAAWQRLANSFLARLSPAQRSQVQALAADAVKGNTSASAALRRLLHGSDPAVHGALCELARWPAGATKALPSRRQRSQIAPISAEQAERIRAGYQRAKIRVNREVIAGYVEKLPESRRGEILSGNFTPQQIDNCVPDRVLQALDADGNYRYRSGNLSDQTSRLAILRQNILHQQKR